MKKHWADTAVIPYQPPVPCGICGAQILVTARYRVCVDTGADLGYVDVCDACRRLLCTCDTCSGWGESGDDTVCRASHPRWVCTDEYDGDSGYDDQSPTEPREWCRDGYRQARPLTVEDVDERIGRGGEQCQR